MAVLPERFADLPLLQETLAMTVDSFEKSGLDDRTYLQVRIAALAATGANPESWAFNLEAAVDSGLTLEDIQSVLIAVTPVIGTARAMAAVGNAVRAAGLEAAMAEE